jgi:hypothetical protein
MKYKLSITVLKAIRAAAVVFILGGLAAAIPWLQEHYGTMWFAPALFALLVALQNWLKNRNK